MAPTQTISTFGPMTSESFISDTDGQFEFTTGGGVTFTFSHPAGATNWATFANATSAGVTGQFFVGTGTFTLTWTNGTGQTQASSVSVTGSFNPGDIQYVTTGGSVPAVSGSAMSAQVSAVKFILSVSMGGVSIGKLGISFNCFAPGTRIATPDGSRAVEDLSEGDQVLTADGRAVPITWLGTQTIDARMEHPKKVNPIRITAGALGYGLPERDLRVTADHALEIDGVLYNAGALVNGVTIFQEQGVLPKGFTYYHVETEAHELLLAEGVPAESFIDYAGRDSFDNGADLGEPIPEMDLPRISAARLVPDHIRARLAPKIAAE